MALFVKATIIIDLAGDQVGFSFIYLG